MKNIDGKFMEIRRFCEKNANPEIVKKYSRYFTEGYDAYGLGREIYETQLAVWFDQWNKDLSLDDYLRLGDKLVSTGKYEEASFAIGFAYSKKEEFTPETFDRLGRWLEKGIRNWGHTDVLSGMALSHFITHKIVGIEALEEWTRSPSKWKRRSVPVVMIDVLKTKIPLKKMLRIVNPLMTDPDKFVQKGLGWFLREAWKLHPAEVEAFLLGWKDVCGRIIVQYATEKMDKKHKERFRKKGKNA